MAQPYDSSYELQVNIELRRIVKEGTYNRTTGESMGFNSKYVIPAAGFAEIAKILGAFEELSESLKPTPLESEND